MSRTRQTGPLVERWFGYFGKHGECRILASGPRKPDHSKNSVLFLHGRLADQRIWRGLCDELHRTLNCYALDLPGFGRSISCTGHVLTLQEYAQLALEFSEEIIGPRKFAIVGHDLGGAIAQLCAIRAPDRIAALAFTNSACMTLPLAPLIPPTQGRLQGTLARWRLRYFLEASTDLTYEHRRLLRSLWNAPGAWQALQYVCDRLALDWPANRGAQASSEIRERLADIHQPSLVLWGARDPLLPPSSASELVRQLPRAYYSEASDCGHWPCLEKMEWVLENLRSFLFRVMRPPEPMQRHIA